MPGTSLSCGIGSGRHRPFRWRDLVNEESKKRVATSQKPEYQPHGLDRALAPWTEDQNRTLDRWNYVPRDYFDEFFDPHDDCTMNGAITIMKTTITGAIMIMKTGRERTGKGLRLDSHW